MPPAGVRFYWPTVKLVALPPDAGGGPWRGKVKHEVNAAVGRFAVRSAATLPLKRLYDDPSHGYDVCDVRRKTCF
jgi:hypothetical protein